MRKWLNPFKLAAAVAALGFLARGGGPKQVKLLGIGQPQGLLIPTAAVALEIKSRDGSVNRVDPRIPLPFLFTWAYRAGRRLGLPLVSTFEPEKLNLRLSLPGKSR
jgi:hypothetical protein